MQNPSAWAGIVSLAFAILVQTAFFAFWLGRVSQRLMSLEEHSKGREDVADKVIRLTVEMEHVNAALGKLVNNSESVNRQLGNIAMGRGGQITEL
ncbi:hypothetical protein [uncultured Brevundimonas sp.]|uniref:hypothetical protein n=1 Tax=uncultured Brevundimonas sp. TaxID=213418 RepID=UPI0025EB6903|nr:hypothetical protein [uncultured Brevundimonas sp.]